MSILFSGPKVKFIDVVYLRQDPIDTTKYIFEYPLGTDFTIYPAIYMYNNYKCTLLNSLTFSLMPNTNRLKIKVPNHLDLSAGSSLRLLCSTKSYSGIDFIDKFGQVGIVYSFDNFTITNQSKYSRLVNTSVVSENLLLGFMADYPVRFPHLTYSGGLPSPNIDLFNGAYQYDLSTNGVDTSRLIGFFNNQYIGPVTRYGDFRPIAFTSSTTGTLEIVCKGVLEFSLSSSGPWVTILNIPVIGTSETVTVYVRCGQLVSSLVRLLNSIKIITTEAV